MAKKKPKKKVQPKTTKQKKTSLHVKKTLQDLKKSKDVYFRKRAEKEEALLPVTDLGTEIRLKKKSLKGTRSQVKNQENKIKDLEKSNRKISNKRKDLEGEYAFADDERKKQIDKLLDSPDYKKKDISSEKNKLKALQGKPFDFIVDDGFKKYKVSSKELEKLWKKGKDPSSLIMKKMQDNTRGAIRHYKELIEREKDTASKARMKKLNRIKDSLEKKLLHTVKQNKQAVESGNMKNLDEVNEYGEKAYSILFRVVGFNIDRIGI